VLSADHLAAKCRSAYPAIAAQVHRDLSTWKAMDRAAILRAEAIWQEQESTSPRSHAEQRDDQAQLERLWSSLTSQGPTAGQERCGSYFSDRAAGGLRSRSPEVFRELEAR
jgi:hypothetical protein